MDIKDILNEGGSIKLNYKDSLDSWYREIRMSWDGHAFFEGFDYYNYRSDLSMDDAIYVFMSVYKSPSNIAYVLSKIKQLPKNPEGDPVYDFERPSDYFLEQIQTVKEQLKKEWEKEFSQEKLDSLKKTKLDWQAELDKVALSIEPDNFLQILTDFDKFLVINGLSSNDLSAYVNYDCNYMFHIQLDLELQKIESVLQKVKADLEESYGKVNIGGISLHLHVDSSNSGHFHTSKSFKKDEI